MRERLTARALLLSPQDRLLLFRFEDTRPEGPHVFWATAGGGIEAGETVLEAVRREVFEETGMSELEIGPVVWRHEHVLELGGEEVLFREDYVLVRCLHEQVCTDRMEALERSLVREARWWALGEIAGSSETIYPAGLARLLGPLLAGDLPSRPFRLNDPQAE
jgi:ADP-ribose pyrophosphatase YjhB (NUDIX family)